MQDDFGKRLMTVMLFRGMDCKTLSERTFITEVSICRFCKGERFPKAPELINICQALDVPLEFFDKPIGEWNTELRLVNGKVMRIDEPAAGVEDARPVIKAKWETGFTYPDGEYWKCTNCKEIIKVRAGAMNFCGHCGAQMEREK